MYYTYDTQGLSETDYDRIIAHRGFSSRISLAQGDHNRGRIISADRLIYNSKEAVAEALPEGYEIVESSFSSSDGMIQKTQNDPTPSGEPATCTPLSNGYVKEDEAVAAVKRTTCARGAQAGLSLLSSFTVIGVITKSTSVLACIQEILNRAAQTDYAACNVLDIFQTVPKLRVSYWENEKKRDQLQELFDKLLCGGLLLTDVRNPFDRIYLKGLCELLHVSL